MANKRMFSKQIVDSDAFLDMPPTSQILYFHLVMRADDDGFIGNPKKIMRMINVSDDDFKILVAKRFILVFPEGVCVIKHWWIHNTIMKDRYHLTAYQDQLKLLKIKDNGSYTEVKDGLLTECYQDDNKVLTVTKLNETKLNEIKLSKDTYGEFKNVFLLKEEYDKLVITFTEKNTIILIEELSGYIASKRKNYASHYATLLNWGRRKVQDYKSKENKRSII